MDRRQLVTGVAGLVMAAAAASGACAAAPPAGSLHMAVCDTRFAAGAAFGDAAARHAPVRAIDGDVTGLWLEGLERHFAHGGAPVAGLVTPRTLHGLVELARGPGVRMVWRGEHRAPGGAGLSHALEGPPSAVARADALLRGPGWSAALADLLLREAAVGGGGRAKLTVRTSAAEDMAPEDALASFVLAPRRPGPI